MVRVTSVNISYLETEPKSDKVLLSKSCSKSVLERNVPVPLDCVCIYLLIYEQLWLLESIIYISTKLVFPPCSRHSTKENCCHFSAGTVIHWGIMDGNEAALQILFSKDLCKAISNALLKTNAALWKRIKSVWAVDFRWWNNSRKVGSACITIKHCQAVSVFSSLPAAPFTCMHCSNNTPWELLLAKRDNHSPVHCSGLRFTLVTSKFQTAQRIGFRPRISNRHSLAPH